MKQKMGNQNKKIIIQVAIRLESVKMRTISTEKNNNGKKFNKNNRRENSANRSIASRASEEKVNSFARFLFPIGIFF